jgi:hypothetical protein
MPTRLSPSPELRARVLAAVRADRANQIEPVAPAAPPMPAFVPSRAVTGGPALPTQDRRVRPAWTAWLVAASFLLALGLGGWNIMLQQQLSQQQGQLDRDRRIVRTLAAADRFWTMRGHPERAPNAIITLALNLSQAQTVLIVKGFPPVEQDRTYQVWLVQDGRQAPVGVFAPASVNEEQTLVIASDLSGVTEAMITIEPAGGSARPTGPVVMDGQL